MLAAAEMLTDFSTQVSSHVEDNLGGLGAGDWREDPVDLRTFVESPAQLGLPPLYPIQLRDCEVLLGRDPKRVFEEPHALERIPLAWAKVKSRNVKRIGWHDEQLYVVYHHGGVYRYDGCSRELFESILHARSTGSALAQGVKGRLAFEKLKVDPDELRIEATWDGRLYQVAVLLWGKGSGKDYLCSIVVTYLVYVLLCLRDPHRFLELAPGENIDVVNVAYNADQAKNVFFAKLKQRVLRWRWLREHYNVREAGKKLGTWKPGKPIVDINDDHIAFPRQIRCWSRHAQNESYEGLNVIAWVMDEASAFLSKLKRENAEKIHGTLRTSATTRFKRRWVGCIISYPRHADDFTMTRHAEARRNPKLGVYASGPYKTWEVNGALGKGDWVEVRPGHKVPAELAADYELLGFEEAEARLECNPPKAVDALIKFPQRLWQAVKRGRPSLIDWHPIITRREVVGADGELRMREFIGVEVTNWGKRLPRGTRMFFHGDPAYSGDSFALAIGHGVPGTIMVHRPVDELLKDGKVTAGYARTQGWSADTVVEWEEDVMRTIIDALIVWRPDPKNDRHVDLLNVDQVIDGLRKHHRIHAGSFDQFESAATVQRLQAAKLNVENEQWSNPFQLLIYRGGRTSFYNDLVTLPDTDTITSTDPLAPGALYELERVQLVEGRKIDHPEGGSKDLCDAVVRVIHHVGESAKKGGLAFGSVYGHKDGYAERRSYAPNSRPAVDPNRTPSPASPGLKDQERRAREERPLDQEVTPARPAPGSRVVTREEAEQIAAVGEQARPTKPRRFTSVRSR